MSSKISYDNFVDKPRIKIAQLTSRLCIGGMSVALILATEGLISRGYSTILLAGRVVGEEASMEEFARCRGILPVQVRSLSRAISIWNDLKALGQLVRFFRREKPTIVHTHTAKAGALGRIAARISGVPICVHTFHGHVFRGHFSSREASIYLGIEKLLARWTDCLVAVSESQGRELVEKYRVAAAGKFTTIPVAFDLARYSEVNGQRGTVRKLAACPAGNPLIGWVGRLAPIKNPELFLKVASLTLAAYPNAKFVIVGDGELRRILEVQLKERNLTDAVTLMGWQMDLRDFYSDVDTVIMTSRHEGTPVALLESMASGKPFVSTDVGGIRDLMVGAPRSIDGMQVFENGILSDASAFHLANGIDYLLRNPMIAAEMGRAARSFVSRVFANDRVVDKLENLYLNLLKQKKFRTTHDPVLNLNATDL